MSSSPIELLHKPHGGNFDVLSSPIELLHKPHGGNFDVFISYWIITQTTRW